ncbi:hypothetical protein [Xanthomonas sp. 3058]|uniref:hypothetical protein n=1 Tax=Xanthomonas sp. 3058 TaxID=3035314 RepID=UPI0016113449|nr:hypothetical protein [Xanthomonas sp. 3058]MBB5862519.1 hypothetical protein [Xanthomonas sp. 3058]
MMQYVGPHPALRATFSRTREKDSALLDSGTKIPFSRTRENDSTLLGTGMKAPFSRTREKVPEGRMRAIAIRALPTANHHRLAWTFATSAANQSIA